MISPFIEKAKCFFKGHDWNHMKAHPTKEAINRKQSYGIIMHYDTTAPANPALPWIHVRICWRCFRKEIETGVPGEWKKQSALSWREIVRVRF